MELKDYIDMAAKKAGNLTALGKMLDLSQPNISNIRAHRKALPDKQLVQLAEYLEIPEIELIRANNIAMGKHVDFWTTWGKAAGICAFSLVTFFVTPSPAEAAPIQEGPILRFVLC